MAKKTVKKQEKKKSTKVQENKKSNKGRKPGIKLKEKEKIYIQISDLYRINISDGMNKSIEKYVTKIKMNDDPDGKWKAGEEYSDWEDIKCYCSTYKYAFDRLHDMMIADKVGKKGTVTLKEFYNIYEEKLKYLSDTFDTRFKDK